jgi:hypothetical protein
MPAVRGLTSTAHTNVAQRARVIEVETSSSYRFGCAQGRLYPKDGDKGGQGSFAAKLLILRMDKILANRSVPHFAWLRANNRSSSAKMRPISVR